MSKNVLCWTGTQTDVRCIEHMRWIIHKFWNNVNGMLISDINQTSLPNPSGVANGSFENSGDVMRDWDADI